MALLVTASNGVGNAGTTFTSPVGTGNAWTASVWFRPATLTSNSAVTCIVGQTSNVTTSPNGWAIVLVNGTQVRLQVQGIANTTPWTIPASAVWDGVWITYVSTGTSVLAYANGALVQTDARTITTLSASLLALRIGGLTNISTTPGAFAELAWFTEALSASDVAEMARGVPANVVRSAVYTYWPLRGTNTTTQSPLVNRSGSTLQFVPFNTFTRTWHPENTPPRIQPVARPDADLTAWVLELEHSSGTRRYASETLGLPQDVEVVGAAVPAALKNAQQLSVTESFSDSVGGFSVPSRVTVRVSNTEHVTVAEALRPRGNAPVAWYRLNDTLREEISATAVTPVGSGAAYVDGPAGGGDQAATFLGTSATSFHVSAPGRVEHNLGSTWTLSFWIKRPAPAQANKYVMNRGNNWAVLYGYTTGQLEFFASGYSGTDPRTGTGVSLSADTWSHIAYVRGVAPADSPVPDLQSWQVYVNGALAYTTTRTFSLAQQSANFSPLMVGGFDASTGRFLGSLFDVAIHPIGLRDAEVKRLYEAGLGRVGLSPTVRYAGTPAYLRRYDRTSGVYQTLLAGTVTDQQAAPGEMQLTLSSFDESILAKKLPAKTVTIGNFPSGRDQSAAVPVVYGQAYVTAPHVGEFNQFNDYAIGFKDSSVVDIFADDRGGTGSLQKISEWASFEGATLNRVSNSQFTASGDWTNELPVGTALRWVDISLGTQTAKVTARTVSAGVTTVTISPAILTETIFSAEATDELEIINGGAGYAVGDKIRFGSFINAQYRGSYVVTAVGAGGAVSGVQQLFRTPLSSAASPDPVNTEATSTTGSGTGLTVWPAASSSNIQYLTAKIEQGRYQVDNQSITSLRINGDAPGTLLLRARNNPANAISWDASAVVADILGNTTYGLAQPIAGSDFDTLTGVAINYALGGDRIQRNAGEFVRDLCAVQGCRLSWDPRSRVWRYRVDKAPTTTVETFGFADGEHNNIKGLPVLDSLSEREAVKDLVLRYGRLGRVQSQGDVTSWLAENEHPFELRRRISDYGSDKILTAQHITGYADASRMLKYQAAIARGYRRSMRIQVGLLGHRVAVGDLVRVRVPRLGIEEVMRVVERTVRLGDSELGLIQYLPEAYTAPTADDFGFVDVYASKFVQDDITTENAIVEPYGDGTNLVLNPDFTIPFSLQDTDKQTIPGWVLNVAGATTATTTNLVRPAGASGDYQGGAAITLKANSNASISIYPSLNLAMTPTSAYDSTVISTGNAARSSPYVFSVYASSPIGWYFAVDQGLGIEIAPFSVTSDRNPSGWRRYYAIYQPTRQSTFRVRLVVRAGNTTGVSFDAMQIERATRTRMYPTPWKRNPATRIDPAVLGTGLLRIMSNQGFGTATAVQQVAALVETTSGTTKTVAGMVPAGSFLLGVTSNVRTTVTHTGDTALTIGLASGTVEEFGRLLTGSSRAVGPLFESEDFNDWTPQYFATAQDVQILAGAPFTAGSIQLVAHVVRLLGGQT